MATMTLHRVRRLLVTSLWLSTRHKRKGIRWRIFTVILFLFLCLSQLTTVQFSFASSSGEDLKQYGKMWDDLQQGWQQEQVYHTKVMDKLKSGPQDAENQKKIAEELSRHQQNSKKFAGQRQIIQDKIISEANSRSAGGDQKGTSKPGQKTAGTDPTSSKGRGMAGDGDYGAGTRTADKVQGVLDDMGIKVQVKTTPSTVELSDGMNMTINKEGSLGKPGTGAHQTQVQVDAHTKDTYVSQSMKEGQYGRDYVEVQDHKKKALGGLTSDPADLPKNPDTARDMVKGATKSLDHLPPDQAKAILDKHGITQQQLADIKEGRANVTPENAEKIQNASRDVIQNAESQTRAAADKEMAQAQKHAESLEKAGKKAEARAIREDLVDSRTKVTETTIANNDVEAGRAKPTSTVDTISGKSGSTAGNAETRGTSLDAPDGKMPAASAETPAGKAKGTTLDTPDGSPRPVTADTPDSKARGPATDAPEGKFGKALDKIGKGMQAVDILSGAQDLKEAAKAGDVEGMGKAAINTADSLVGGVKGTVDTLVTKGTDRANAQSAIDQANRSHLEHQNQQIAIDLQRSGMSKDQIQQILDAKAQGNTGPLQESYGKIGKTVPDLVIEKPVEGDDTALDRAGQVATGMKDKAIKAGTFIKETAQDVSEIATGLTEKGVAQEVINQQSKNLSPANISDGLEAVKKTYEASQAEKGAEKALADKLVEKGASREEADKAAAAFSGGSRSELDTLKEKLGLPVAKPGEQNAAQGNTSPDKQIAQEGKEKDKAGKAPDEPSSQAQASTQTEKAGKEKDTQAKEKQQAAAGRQEKDVKGKSTSSAISKEGGGSEKGGVASPGEQETSGKTGAPATTVEKGYVQGADGSRITITEKVDGQGNVISQTHTTTDHTGKVTEQTVYPGAGGEGRTSHGDGSDSENPLQSSEPSAEKNANISSWEPGGSNGSTLDTYADKHSAEAQGKTQGAMITISQTSQMEQSANVGNQMISDAKNTRDQGGRDSQLTQISSAQKTNQQDNKNSWGNVLGDAITSGIEQGTGQFASTIGSAGAHAAANDLFGSPGSKHDHGNSGNTAGSSPAVNSGNTSSPGSKGQQGHTSSSRTGKPSSSQGGSHTGSGSSSQGCQGNCGQTSSSSAASSSSVSSSATAGTSATASPVSTSSSASASTASSGQTSTATSSSPPASTAASPSTTKPASTSTSSSTTDPDNPPASLMNEAYQKGLAHGRKCKAGDDKSRSNVTTMDCVLVSICFYDNSQYGKWVIQLRETCQKGHYDGYAGK